MAQTLTAYAALLRAVNVGGTGKLAMDDLRQICQDSGFQDVTTYIQSGNAVFRSEFPEAQVKKTLAQALTQKIGKPVGVLVRTGTELARLVAANPFPEAAPNQVLILFLDEQPSPDVLTTTILPDREKLALGDRELFIHFPNGMGRSKLKIPFQKTGTGRNLNTVTKLAAMAQELAKAHP